MSEIRKALVDLLAAADEITCALHEPEAWTLGWHEAIELRDAGERARRALDADDGEVSA